MSKMPEDFAKESLMPQPDLITDPVAPAFSPVGSKRSFSQIAAVISLIVLDLALLALSLTLAYVIRMYVLPTFIHSFPTNAHPYLIYRLWWIPGISILTIAYEGLYTSRLPFWQETKQLVKAITLGFLLMMAVMFVGKISDEVSRTVLMLGYVVSIIVLPLGRLAGKTILSKIGIGVKPVIILGVGKTGEMVAKAMLREKFLGYRIVGFLDDDPDKLTHGAWIDGVFFPVLGGFKDCDRIMKQHGIRHLILAAPGMPARQMVDLVNHLQQRAASVTVIPDLFGVPVEGVEANYYFDDQMLSFRIGNRLAYPWNTFAKRAFDITVGIFALIVLLPIMTVIGAAIKLDSRGPIFFSHRRLGRGGKEFGCLKFRTMAVNAQEALDDLFKKDPSLKDEWEKNFKLKDDPRITRVGKLLRKASLDELPQIFNVLKGEMSFVGPRPIVRKELPRFSPYAHYYFMMRPGITGLWQVSGRSDIDYPERVRLESWYVRNWSLWLDITLLVRTVGVVLAKKGAY